MVFRSWRPGLLATDASTGRSAFPGFVARSAKEPWTELRDPNTTYYESLVRANPIIVEDGIGPDGCISPPEDPDIGWETEVE